MCSLNLFVSYYILTLVFNDSQRSISSTYTCIINGSQQPYIPLDNHVYQERPSTDLRITLPNIAEGRFRKQTTSHHGDIPHVPGRLLSFGTKRNVLFCHSNCDPLGSKL